MDQKAIYTVVELGKNSWRIEENGVRCFLFAGRETALLVDSGYGSGDLAALARELTDKPVALVNTHADGDHTGNNAQFGQVTMHPDDFPKYREDEPDGIVEPVRDRIDLGGRKFEVIHIPGHTPGSIALLDAENRILVAGDSVQAGMIFMFGKGRDLGRYIQSLEKLHGIAGRFDTIYPSHGPFPVYPDILPPLIHGAKQLLAGELPPLPAPFDVPAKLYDVTVAKILY
ncbi:MAG: MBL fold metallo-hydrolase [Oscillospiraceae bacterium]|jgi:glyoxylase-like metal-dependent hydrolase (beta-lactamase superfamily II)|nr:MBL fold metallo-hydrolase [Oscillospiraceae bacterium]